jgi:hypothetical protein
VDERGDESSSSRFITDGSALEMFFLDLDQSLDAMTYVHYY